MCLMMPSRLLKQYYSLLAVNLKVLTIKTVLFIKQTYSLFSSNNTSLYCCVIKAIVDCT